MFKVVSIARLVGLLTAALFAWGLSPANTWAQGCCENGAGGHVAGSHAGHQSYPVNPSLHGGQSGHQHGACGECPMCFCLGLHRAGTTGSGSGYYQVANFVAGAGICFRARAH